ncbi:MAG: DUF4080 domain-containing protein [Clostridia bacterium]|nr:DUF4080 domain-containing protein [Clostridia bacterium]
MKVVIACLNSKFVHASLSPWCLLAGVRAFATTPCEATVKESTVNADTEAFAREILAERPAVVALSCYIWNITKTLALCRLLKQHGDCEIVLGGPEAAYRPQELLKRYPFVDYVLSGEGEWAFPSFLDHRNGELSAVCGLTYRENGAILTNPVREYKDTPPSPYCDEFFEQLNGRISYIETSRGCPYRCAFCLSGRCSPLRFFELEGVKRDLLRLASSGTQTVKFVDRTFNADAERANEILRFIRTHYGREIPSGVCFHFEIAGDILKDSTLRILSSMPHGAVQLEIGMQSFNEDVLRAVNRKTDTKKLIRNIRTLLSFRNMHIHIDLIAGLTGEDLESFRRSFRIAYDLRAHMLQMGFLKLLHGAAMREEPERYPCTFADEPPYEVTSTPWLSGEELRRLKGCEDALDRLYNSGRFLYSLSYLTEEVGLEPFELFCEFGNAFRGDSLSLTAYTERFYTFFADRCDKAALRDAILCDLLCCSSLTQAPKALLPQDPLYKRAKRCAARMHGTAVKAVWLSSKGQLAVVDPSKPKNFHGRSEPIFYRLEDLPL